MTQTASREGTTHQGDTSRWRQLLGVLGIIVAIPVLVALVYSFGVAYVLIQAQNVPPTITPGDLDIPYEPFEVMTADNVILRGWYIPPGDQPTVAIFLHGLSSNRTHFIQEAALLHEAGYGAVLFDLRGHGESEGNLSSFGTVESRDVEHILAYIAGRPETIDQIVIIGESAGGAASLLALTKYDEIDGAVTISAVASIRRLVSDINGRSNLPVVMDSLVIMWVNLLNGVNVDALTPENQLPQIEKPILIIHGGRDTTVPVHHAEVLHAAAAPHADLWIVPEAGHGVVGWLRHEEYEERLLTFMSAFAG